MHHQQPAQRFRNGDLLLELARAPRSETLTAERRQQLDANERGTGRHGGPRSSGRMRPRMR